MEGLTTVVFRRLHARLFGGADRYYLPFITPTREPRFTERQMRELAPGANEGIPAIPQLLTRSVEDFVWAAKALADLGYQEVNLNLGCPAGTVTAKLSAVPERALRISLARFRRRAADHGLDQDASGLSQHG